MNRVADRMGMSEGIEYTCSQGRFHHVHGPLVPHPSAVVPPLVVERQHDELCGGGQNGSA